MPLSQQCHADDAQSHRATEVSTTVYATVALRSATVFETVVLKVGDFRVGRENVASIALAQLQGASPMEEVPLDTARSRSARDLGRQTSTASTGRRGLAWADSLG